MPNSYKAYGDEGQKEIVTLIKCPNCKKPLMSLPESFPLVDVQCTACYFRAQIKTTSSNPLKPHIIRGSGWTIMKHVIQSGYPIPPLIINYKWHAKGESKQEIRFYPFVKKENLTPRLANIHGGKRKHKMFDYDLTGLPYLKLL